MAEEKVEPTSIQEALESNKSVFEGHPADVPVDDTGTDDEAPIGDEETSVGDETPVEDETPEVEKPKEKVEPEPPKFKYETHEKAETAYKEAERLITERATEAKRERERAEDLQRQLNEALLKVKPEPTPEEAKPKGPTSAARMGALLNQINLLDPEADGYQEQVAGLWGELEDERRANMDAELEARVKTAITEYDNSKTEAQQKAAREKADRDAIIKTAQTKATDAGLDMKEGSVDDALFWAMSHNAPEGSTDDQIDWTINAVKTHKATIVAPYVKSANKANKTQNKNAVLERAGQGKPEEVATQETPLSLMDALSKVQRRI